MSVRQTKYIDEQEIHLWRHVFTEKYFLEIGSWSYPPEELIFEISKEDVAFVKKYLELNKESTKNPLLTDVILKEKRGYKDEEEA